MDLKTILSWKIADAFASTRALVDLIPGDSLDWKPASENNWWTIGQLLHHLGQGCGAGIRGFVTGDWGCPEGVDMSAMKPEDMLPPAEACPTVKSLEEARALLEADEQLAYEMLDKVDQDTLFTRQAEAPWFPGMQRSLGYFVLSMIDHQNVHKTQLFSMLKLLGLPVGTHQLWAPGGLNPAAN